MRRGIDGATIGLPVGAAAGELLVGGAVGWTVVCPRDGEPDGSLDDAALGVAVVGAVLGTDVIGMVDGDPDAGERVGGSGAIKL